MNVQVSLEDLGLSSLPRDVERAMEGAVMHAARKVEDDMRSNIQARGYVDSGDTLSSVQATQTDPLQWDIGPRTWYALLGELGWDEATKGGARHVPGLHFARDALYGAEKSFRAEVELRLVQLAGG